MKSINYIPLPEDDKEDKTKARLVKEVLEIQFKILYNQKFLSLNKLYNKGRFKRQKHRINKYICVNDKGNH